MLRWVLQPQFPGIAARASEGVVIYAFTAVGSCMYYTVCDASVEDPVNYRVNYL